MNLPAGWLERQLEHAAAEFEKWPTWMKEAARRDELERQASRSVTVCREMRTEEREQNPPAKHG